MKCTEVNFSVDKVDWFVSLCWAVRIDSSAARRCRIFRHLCYEQATEFWPYYSEGPIKGFPAEEDKVNWEESLLFSYFTHFWLFFLGWNTHINKTLKQKNNALVIFIIYYLFSQLYITSVFLFPTALSLVQLFLSGCSSSRASFSCCAS